MFVRLIPPKSESCRTKEELASLSRDKNTVRQHCKALSVDSANTKCLIIDQIVCGSLDRR